MFEISQKGFSFLELLIVISIIAILLAGGTGFYHGFSKTVALTSAAKTIRADLRYMRSKSMARESDLAWGAHFVNGTADYYELFSTPTTYADGSMVVMATTTLPGGVAFFAPGEGTTQDIIFNKVAGTTTAATVGVSFGDLDDTITVSVLGAIY
jgi:prepilin-type N-terminal cleavage/methylation domain-containing protein